MPEAVLLQAMRLKGRLSAEPAAACAGITVEEAQSALAEFELAGWAQRAGSALRLTPAGKERLELLLHAERLEIDALAMQAHYDAFTGINSELKSLITAWQMKDPQTPNDHTDDAYDRQIVERLVALDGHFSTLLGEIVTVAPRLRPYRDRFSQALTRVQDGDHGFIARPIADSYHTVWFELHEELIGLLGLSRVEEAAAGRAH